jgi:hypothetical protein
MKDDDEDDDEDVVDVVEDAPPVVDAPAPVEAAPDDEVLEPPEVVAPTVPLIATTTPAIGDFSVAAARFSWAVVSAAFAWSTESSCELTDSCAELTLEAPPPCEEFELDVVSAADSALSSEAYEYERSSSARVSDVCASLTAVARSPVASVPSTWPFLTVAPSATFTVLMVPEVANDAFAVVTGSIEPVAVMLVLTTPCWTVPVSCVVAEAVALASERIENKKDGDGDYDDDCDQHRVNHHRAREFHVGIVPEVSMKLICNGCGIGSNRKRGCNHE